MNIPFAFMGSQKSKVLKIFRLLKSGTTGAWQYSEDIGETWHSSSLPTLSLNNTGNLNSPLYVDTYTNNVYYTNNATLYRGALDAVFGPMVGYSALTTNPAISTYFNFGVVGGKFQVFLNAVAPVGTTTSGYIEEVTGPNTNTTTFYSRVGNTTNVSHTPQLTHYLTANYFMASVGGFRYQLKNTAVTSTASSCSVSYAVMGSTSALTYQSLGSVSMSSSGYGITTGGMRGMALDLSNDAYLYIFGPTTATSTSITIRRYPRNKSTGIITNSPTTMGTFTSESPTYLLGGIPTWRSERLATQYFVFGNKLVTQSGGVVVSNLHGLVPSMASDQTTLPKTATTVYGHDTQGDTYLFLATGGSGCILKMTGATTYTVVKSGLSNTYAFYASYSI